MIEKYAIELAEPAHQRTQQETDQDPTWGRVTYQEAGSGPAVVFLHGIGAGGAQFTPQLEALAAAGYRAIAWDMPGYGGSTPLPLVSIDALTATLGTFLAGLGLDRPAIVGHSLGGMLLLRLLAVAPHTAGRAVLSQTSAAFGSRDPAWARQFVADRLAPLDAGHSMADLAHGMVAGMVGDAPDPAGLVQAEQGIAATSDSTYREMVLAMPGFDQRDALAHIAVPTLVVAGSRDTNAPAPGMERMAARIPCAGYVCIDGAGHLVHLEQPARFNAALLAFLA